VEVTINEDGQRLLIQVADSGPGMDATTFERAMQRGYSTKTDAGSSHQGLGLALIGQIAKRHGGKVTAEITYGSVVSVTFNSRSQS
jgi:sensor histidine kinase regulating citrate/malate metabolism